MRRDRRTRLAAEAPPHFPGKAKSVIFLFMSGGVSHVDSFDPEAEADRRPRQASDLRSSGDPNRPGYEKLFLKKPDWKFAPRGKSGIEVSDLFPACSASSRRHRADPLDAHQPLEPLQRHARHARGFLPDNLPPVYADRVLLEQVLLNLLRNAIDANRDRHPDQPSLIVMAVEQGSGASVEISVQDQGPGVSEPELEQIFTPFYTSKPDGLGLGLSMSRSIIEGFGGELNARRQPVGLLMCCRLPLAGPTKQQQE